MQTKSAPGAQDFDVKPGDIYSLGSSHRLMCGDATNKEDVRRLLDGRKPTLVVTSPPYARQRDYDRPIACWDSMMLSALDGHGLAENVQILVNLGVIHSNGEWRPYWNQWLSNMRQSQWKVFAQYVWHKMRGVPRANDGRLKSSHEFIFHLNRTPVLANNWAPTAQPGRVRIKSHDYAKKDGSKRKANSLIVTAPTKTPQSVFQIFPVNNNQSTGHPAQMPIDLASQLIKSWKKEDCAAYDPFAGSGTTLHAAKQEGVSGLGMEISPTYTSIALARWAKAYPEQPINKVAVAP